MPGFLFSLLVSAQASHMGDPNLLCVGCRGHFGFEEGFQRCPVCFELHRIQTLVEQRRLLLETGPPVAGILADTYTRLLECNTIAINRKDQSPAVRESGVVPEKGEQKAHPAGSCGAASLGSVEGSPNSSVHLSPNFLFERRSVEGSPNFSLHLSPSLLWLCGRFP